MCGEVNTQPPGTPFLFLKVAKLFEYPFPVLVFVCVEVVVTLVNEESQTYRGGFGGEGG